MWCYFDFNYAPLRLENKLLLISINQPQLPKKMVHYVFQVLGNDPYVTQLDHNQPPLGFTDFPQALEAKDVTKAMILALALNDYALLRKVYEQVAPIGWVKFG